MKLSKLLDLKIIFHVTSISWHVCHIGTLKMSSLRIAFWVEQHFLYCIHNLFCLFQIGRLWQKWQHWCGRRWARYQFPNGLAWWEAIPGPDQQHHHPWTADDCCRHLLGSRGCNVEWRTKSLWCYVSIIIMISSDESGDLVYFQSITLIRGLSIHVKTTLAYVLLITNMWNSMLLLSLYWPLETWRLKYTYSVY